MTVAVAWLRSHRVVTLLLGLIYYILTVVLHDQVQGIFLSAKDQFGLKAYTLGLIAITAGCLLLVTLLILKKSSPGRRLGLVYWFISIVLIAIAYIFILVLPSEYIHIAQYSVLAVFIYPLCLRFTDTVVWVTILDALDEWYQYAILHADWGIYFDFNDVVLNLLGGGMGVAVIYALLSPSVPNVQPKSKPFPSPGLWILWTILGAGVILRFTGKLTLFPTEGASPWIALSRSDYNPTFWTIVDWGKNFHVLHPLSGVVLVLILTLCYRPLDKPSK